MKIHFSQILGFAGSLYSFNLVAFIEETISNELKTSGLEIIVSVIFGMVVTCFWYKIPENEHHLPLKKYYAIFTAYFIHLLKSLNFK